MLNTLDRPEVHTEESTIRALRLQETESKNSLRHIWITAFLLFILAVAVFSYFRLASPLVESLIVSSGPVERVLAVNGRVRPRDAITIIAKVSGQVTALTFDEGDSVKEGDIIGRIDDRRVSAILEQAQAAIGGQRRSLDQARRDLERIRLLFENGTVSESALETAALAVDRGEDDLQQLEAAAREVKVTADDYALIAPMSGTILKRPIDLGQSVEIGTVIFEIAPLDNIDIETEVDETYSGLLEIGQSARVALISEPDDVIIGEVSYLAPQIDTASGGRLVRIAIPQPKNMLPAGLSADVNIVVARLPNSITVPRGAIIKDGQPRVLIIRDGIVSERLIYYTEWPAETVVVTEGLLAGDRIVLAPENLSPGDTVATE
ncbi:MAG: efflux RND transporter periplasmic adaptor subunit [Rhodospirillaceae bacterium]